MVLSLAKIPRLSYRYNFRFPALQAYNILIAPEFICSALNSLVQGRLQGEVDATCIQFGSGKKSTLAERFPSDIWV